MYNVYACTSESHRLKIRTDPRVINLWCVTLTRALARPTARAKFLIDAAPPKHRGGEGRGGEGRRGEGRGGEGRGGEGRGAEGRGGGGEERGRRGGGEGEREREICVHKIVICVLADFGALTGSSQYCRC